MVDTLIPYINGLIDALDIFDNTYELTEIVKMNNEQGAPAIYCENGEYHHPDIETNVLFHIRRGDIEREETISDLYCGTDVKETHNMSLIAVFSKDTIKDDKYVSAKIAQNINNVIGNQTNVTIRKALGLYSWRVTATSWTDNTQEIWEDLFTGVDFRMDSEIGMVRIEYAFELFGPIKCFTTYNCDGSDTAVDVVQAIIDKYCEETVCPDCPAYPQFSFWGIETKDDAGSTGHGMDTIGNLPDAFWNNDGNGYVKCFTFQGWVTINSANSNVWYPYLVDTGAIIHVLYRSATQCMLFYYNDVAQRLVLWMNVGGGGGAAGVSRQYAFTNDNLKHHIQYNFYESGGVGQFQLFVDSVELSAISPIGSLPATFPQLISTDTIEFGQFQGGGVNYNSNVVFDEMSIRASSLIGDLASVQLSADQAAQLYNSGEAINAASVGVQTHVIGHWHCGDGDIDPVAGDSSGNGFNLNINNTCEIISL